MFIPENHTKLINVLCRIMQSYRILTMVRYCGNCLYGLCRSFKLHDYEFLEVEFCFRRQVKKVKSTEKNYTLDPFYLMTKAE
jgi:hypothetical protein